MNAIEFISIYDKMVDELSAVLKPEAVALLKSLDPHEIIEPEAYFSGRTHAIGFITHVSIQQMTK